MLIKEPAKEPATEQKKNHPDGVASKFKKVWRGILPFG